MPGRKDVAVVRDLAARVAEIAALPVQEEKRALWRKLNARKPARPMVMIDQVCWNEMNVGDELTLRCADAECRGYEDRLRRTLYQWKHFPVDMVVEPFIGVPKAIRNTGFGVEVRRRSPSPTRPTRSSATSSRTSSRPKTTWRRSARRESATTRPRRNAAWPWPTSFFDGLLEVRPWGADPYLSLWDPIATWMGVENALYALVDKPDFMHRLVGRVDGRLHEHARPIGEPGTAVRAPEPDPLHGRLHRRAARAGLRPAETPHEGPLDVRPGADVRHRLARHVQGIRGRLCRPHLRALRPGLLRLLRSAGPAR